MTKIVSSVYQNNNKPHALPPPEPAYLPFTACECVQRQVCEWVLLRTGVNVLKVYVAEDMSECVQKQVCCHRTAVCTVCILFLLIF